MNETIPDGKMLVCGDCNERFDQIPKGPMCPECSTIGEPCHLVPE